MEKVNHVPFIGQVIGVTIGDIERFGVIIDFHGGARDYARAYTGFKNGRSGGGWSVSICLLKPAIQGDPIIVSEEVRRITSVYDQYYDVVHAIGVRKNRTRGTLRYKIPNEDNLLQSTIDFLSIYKSLVTSTDLIYGEKERKSFRENIPYEL